MEYRKQGNKFFKKKQYIEAIERYTRFRRRRGNSSNSF